MASELTERMMVAVAETERAYAQKVVAVVLSLDERIEDMCFAWQTGLSFAQDGWRVVAIADDSGVSVDEAQRMYSAAKLDYMDCWGAYGD